MELFSIHKSWARDKTSERMIREEEELQKVGCKLKTRMKRQEGNLTRTLCDNYYGLMCGLDDYRCVS